MPEESQIIVITLTVTVNPDGTVTSKSNLNGLDPVFAGKILIDVGSDYLVRMAAHHHHHDNGTVNAPGT